MYMSYNELYKIHGGCKVLRLIAKQIKRSLYRSLRLIK